jgi:hypothetical protein
MKRVLFLLFLVALAVVTRAQFLAIICRPPVNSAEGSVDENYEATGTGVGGYDLSGWAEAGSVGSITNANYATAPAPFEGAQSLNLAHTGFDQILTSLDMFPASSSGTNEMSGYFQCYWQTQFVGTTFFAIGATNSDFMLRLATTTGGAINLYTASNAAAAAFPSTSTATTATNILYHFWWNYAKGSSANNSTGQVWFTNSATRPADGSNNHVKMVNGTNGFNIEQLFVLVQNFSALSDNVIYDKVRVRIGPISVIDGIIP